MDEQAIRRLATLALALIPDPDATESGASKRGTLGVTERAALRERLAHLDAMHEAREIARMILNEE